MMTASCVLAFAGVGLEIFWVASITLVILVFALLAAAANYFFRNVGRFDDDLREATMDLEPAARRRFFELYESRHPKNVAVAWFLAVGLGPAGANLYRGEWPAFFAAVVSLNGFGAWWLEAIFTTPQLVLMKNDSYIAWARQIVDSEFAHRPAGRSELTVALPTSSQVLVAR